MPSRSPSKRQSAGRSASAVQQLRALAGDPAAQSAAAAELLSPRLGQEVVRSAVAVLIDHPNPDALEGLRQLYAHFAADGVRRDPGSYLRSRILRAMRTLCTPDDLPLLEQALLTYEYPPPDKEEDCGLLRSAALVALVELDEQRARYHAARLLSEPFSNPMSGEPGISAAEVLAAQGEYAALVTYACQAEHQLVPEVAGACLRSLVDLPDAVLSPLVSHFAACEQPVIVVGLVDLLLAHPELDVGMEYVAALLAQTENLDLYRYVTATLIATGNPTWRALLLAGAQVESSPAKAAVLLDVLEPMGDAPDVAQWLPHLQAAAASNSPVGRRSGRHSGRRSGPGG